MRTGRTSRAALPRGAPLAAAYALLCTLAFGGCYPRAADPVGLPAPPLPFVRAPYVQAVDSAGAWIVWMTDRPLSDTLLYRPAGTAASWEGVAAMAYGSRSRRARVGQLPASSRIEYRVHAGGTHLGPFRLSLAPPPSSESPLRVLAFGDSGWGSPAQLRLASRMAAREWDLIVHTGDIAYSHGSESELTRRHFRVYAPLLASTPFFPAPGNHDLETAGGAPYDAAFVWNPPFPGVRYYSFRWGNTMFVSLDTSSDSDDVRGLRGGRGRQYAWLEGTLREAAADPTVRWTVVFAHQPLYSHAVGISGHGHDRGLRRWLAPMYDRYGVDLVLAGHEHHYERLHPLRGGRRVEPGCGPVYVVTGGGGASRYARGLRPSALAGRLSRAHHFVALSIGPERIDGEAIDAEGNVIDSFRIRPFAGEATGPDTCGA